MRTVQSNIWFQCLGGGMWLAGAGFAICWMLRSGGLLWPALVFSLWDSLLAGAFLLAAVEAGKPLLIGQMVYTALKHGLSSGLVVILGSLFVEFWPITVSTACMFAVCRSFKRDDGMAYN